MAEKWVVASNWNKNLSNVAKDCHVADIMAIHSMGGVKSYKFILQRTDDKILWVEISAEQMNEMLVGWGLRTPNGIEKMASLEQADSSGETEEASPKSTMGELFD